MVDELIVFAAAAFLVVADEGYGRQVPFAFLEKVREEFQQKYADKGRTSPAHSLDKVFGYAKLHIQLS